MNNPRNFPIRVEDQPAIGAQMTQLSQPAAGYSPTSKFGRPATLDDVVYELRMLRKDLANRSLEARCTRVWVSIKVTLSRIADYFRWS